ncbi:hypothetical protein GCM10007908_03500 [Rhizobium albus]|nr:hypothetical protein GCM10007908_03500 [Rhizobium albus]
MSWQDWHIGMKVVCVGYEGTPKPPGFWEEWCKDWGIIKPDRGCVYTIRDMRIMSDGVLRIRLDEIRNPIVAFVDAPNQEPWFTAKAFRPVAGKKTDISVFTAMLDGVRQVEPA